MFNFAPASLLVLFYIKKLFERAGLTSPDCSDGYIRTDKKVKRFIERVGGFLFPPFYFNPFRLFDFLVWCIVPPV